MGRSVAVNCSKTTAGRLAPKAAGARRAGAGWQAARRTSGNQAARRIERTPFVRRLCSNRAIGTANVNSAAGHRRTMNRSIIVPNSGSVTPSVVRMSPLERMRFTKALSPHCAMMKLAME